MESAMLIEQSEVVATEAAEVSASLVLNDPDSLSGQRLTNEVEFAPHLTVPPILTRRT